MDISGACLLGAFDMSHNSLLDGMYHRHARYTHMVLAHTKKTDEHATGSELAISAVTEWDASEVPPMSERLNT